MEIVKAAIDGWNRRDWDAVFQDVAPGFEADWSRALGPWRGVFKLDQFRGALEEFTGGFESVRIEPDDFIEAGDVVVVPLTGHVKGREGIATLARVTFVLTVRDGAIERVAMYQERREALEAVGLSEQDAHADS